MPIIQIQLFEGLPAEQKERLIRETSDTITNVLACSLSTVRVLIQEIPTENWGIAGESAKKKLEQSSKSGEGISTP